MLEKNMPGMEKKPARKMLWKEVLSFNPEELGELEAIGSTYYSTNDFGNENRRGKIKKLISRFHSKGMEDALEQGGNEHVLVLYVDDRPRGYMDFRIAGNLFSKKLLVEMLEVDPDFRNARTVKAFLAALRSIVKRYRVSTIVCSAVPDTEAMYELLSEGKRDKFDHYLIPVKNLEEKRLYRLLRKRARTARPDVRERQMDRETSKGIAQDMERNDWSPYENDWGSPDDDWGKDSGESDVEFA